MAHGLPINAPPQQREILMLSIDSYWKYENRPGIIVEYEDDCVGGFYLQQGALEWEEMTEWDVLQWFKGGGKLSKSEFEELFGKVGVDIPDLP
jgi:hypothetical protein